MGFLKNALFTLLGIHQIVQLPPVIAFRIPAQVDGICTPPDRYDIKRLSTSKQHPSPAITKVVVTKVVITEYTVRTKAACMRDSIQGKTLGSKELTCFCGDSGTWQLSVPSSQCGSEVCIWNNKYVVYEIKAVSNQAYIDLNEDQTLIIRASGKPRVIHNPTTTQSRQDKAPETACGPSPMDALWKMISSIGGVVVAFVMLLEAFGFLVFSIMFAMINSIVARLDFLWNQMETRLVAQTAAEMGQMNNILVGFIELVLLPAALCLYIRQTLPRSTSTSALFTIAIFNWILILFGYRFAFLIHTEDPASKFLSTLEGLASRMVQRNSIWEVFEAAMGLSYQISCVIMRIWTVVNMILTTRKLIESFKDDWTPEELLELQAFKLMEIEEKEATMRS